MKISRSLLALVLCCSLVACTVNQVLDDINVGIQLAANIAQAIGAVSPQDAALIQSLSSIASGIMQVVQNSYAAYEKSGAKTDLEKVQAAVAVGQAQFQNALQAAHIVDPKTAAKVTAWGNLVLVCLRTILDAIPALQQTQAVGARTRSVVRVPWAKDLQAQWATNVCGGDKTCAALVKVPKHGLAKLIP